MQVCAWEKKPLNYLRIALTVWFFNNGFAVDCLFRFIKTNKTTKWHELNYRKKKNIESAINAASVHPFNNTVWTKNPQQYPYLSLIVE